MAISDGGFFGKYRGRVGNLVYYQYKGKTVTRTIGERTAGFTENQLASQQAMGLVVRMLKPVLLFINVGFNGMALGTDKSPHNFAVRFNRKHAIMGSYPEQSIDFSKVCFSKGSLSLAINPTVEKITDGLQFNWLAIPQMLYPESADQAMLLAYLPDSSAVFYKIYGANRNKGADHLEIPEPKRNDKMEIYLSFCSADRKSQSDSQYLGTING